MCVFRRVRTCEVKIVKRCHMWSHECAQYMLYAVPTFVCDESLQAAMCVHHNTHSMHISTALVCGLI